MIGCVVLMSLVGFVDRRRRAAVATGAVRRVRVWRSVWALLGVATLVWPFYCGRVTADVRLASIDAVVVPRVHGGPVDETVARLHEAGFDGVVSVTNEYAIVERDWLTVAAVEEFAREDRSSINARFFDKLDLGRTERSLPGVTDAIERRVLPLMLARSYAGAVCSNEPTAAKWHRAEIMFDGYEAEGVDRPDVDESAVALMRSEIDERCGEVLRLIDSDALSGSILPSGNARGLLWKAFTLQYEPGSV